MFLKYCHDDIFFFENFKFSKYLNLEFDFCATPKIFVGSQILIKNQILIFSNYNFEFQKTRSEITRRPSGATQPTGPPPYHLQQNQHAVERT